jgi:YggT family protein
MVYPPLHATGQMVLPSLVGTGRGKRATTRIRAMILLLGFIAELLSIYLFLLFIAAVLSWLVVFNIVNTRHPAVSIIGDILYRITEPFLKPIRNYVPNVGGLDLSFLVLFVLVWFLRDVVIGNLILMLR